MAFFLSFLKTFIITRRPNAIPNALKLLLTRKPVPTVVGAGAVADQEVCGQRPYPSLPPLTPLQPSCSCNPRRCAAVNLSDPLRPPP